MVFNFFQLLMKKLLFVIAVKSMVVLLGLQNPKGFDELPLLFITEKTLIAYEMILFLGKKLF